MKSHIIAPSIGDSTKFCVLTRWHKNDSCLVAQGDLIATLETKKATLDIEAEHDGCLYHSQHEGMTVRFGDSIGYIDHDGLDGTAVRITGLDPKTADSLATDLDEMGFDVIPKT